MTTYSAKTSLKNVGKSTIIDNDENAYTIEIDLNAIDGIHINPSNILVTVLNGTKEVEVAFMPKPMGIDTTCLLYTSPSPRDLSTSRMPSSA